MKITQSYPISQPAPATHSLMIKVLSKDATIKKLAVKYCASDHWAEALRFDYLSTGELIKRYLYPVISRDKNAVAIAASIIDQVTGHVVVKFPPVLLRPNNIKSQAEQLTINP